MCRHVDRVRALAAARAKGWRRTQRRAEELGVLGHSEGIALVLRRSEMEEVVRGEIGSEPQEENHGESNESSAIVDRGEEGEQEHPEGCIVKEPHEPAMVGESLFHRHIVRCVLAKPCVPHGRVVLDDQSEESSENRQGNQGAPSRPTGRREGDNNKNQRGYPETEHEQVVPAHGQEGVLCHWNPTLTTMAIDSLGLSMECGHE